MVGIPARARRRYPARAVGRHAPAGRDRDGVACDPKVLIADEPTTALDVMVQAQILELLDALCRELGLACSSSRTTCRSSRSCATAARHVRGRIVEQGPVDALYHDPRHPYTRLLFAATPDLDDRDEAVVSIPGAPPRLDAPLDGCPFRPRCDRAIDRCETDRPRARPVGDAPRAPPVI